MTYSISPWNLIRSMKMIDYWGNTVNANLVGASRVGYKQFDLFFDGANATSNLQDPRIGSAGKQIAETSINIANTQIDFSQGELVGSNQWMHTAVLGEGFFMTTSKISNPAPEDIQFTRDGEWYLDSDGMLRTKEGLYVLDGSTIPGSPNPSTTSTPPWAGSVFDLWNDRERLKVTNTKTYTITRDTVVELEVDTASLVSSNKLQPDLDDLRIGYWDGSAWSALDMEIVGNPPTPASDTKIRFRLKDDLQPNQTISNKYYLFYENAGATAPPNPTIPIGTIDQFTDLDDFDQLPYSPGTDPVGDTARSVEDWLNVAGKLQTQNWVIGIQPSPSDTWPGAPAGFINYTHDGVTGYTINGISVNTPGAVVRSQVYKTDDGLGNFKFVDQNGLEITMKVIKGTNEGGTVDPLFDFSLSSDDLNALRNALDPTKTDWVKFDPSDVTGALPDLTTGDETLTYNTVPGPDGRWGNMPYKPGSGVTDGMPYIPVGGGWTTGVASFNNEMWYPGAAGNTISSPDLDGITDTDTTGNGNQSGDAHIFRKTFNNTTGAPVNISINTGVDAYARFSLNGTVFSTGAGGWDYVTNNKPYTITLQPGQNEIIVEAYDDNVNTPRVQLYTTTATPAVDIKADSTWEVMDANLHKSVWTGDPTNGTDSQYLLVRQPIEIGDEGVIRKNQTITIEGASAENCNVYIRTEAGNLIELQKDIVSGNNTFSFTFNHNQFPPGLNHIEVYASKDIGNVPADWIKLNMSDFQGYTAGAVNYVNGQGYNFTAEQLYLQPNGYDAGTGKMNYKVVNAGGIEPQMNIPTGISTETHDTGSFGTTNNGTIVDNGTYGNGWINRTGASIENVGGSYWNALGDVIPVPAGGTGGGDIHVSHDLLFNNDLLEAPPSYTENVTFSGTVNANDGFNVGVMSGSFAALPGDWTNSNGYGDPTTFDNTPVVAGMTRIYSAGTNLAPLALPASTVTTTSGSATFTQTFSTGVINETSTILLSGLDGDVGRQDPAYIPFQDDFETTLAAKGWTVNMITGNPTVNWQTDNNTDNGGLKSAYFGNPTLDNYFVPPSALVPPYTQDFSTGSPYSLGEHLFGSANASAEGWQVPSDPADGSWVVRSYTAIPGIPSSFGNILYQEINQGGFGSAGSYILKGDYTWDNYSFSATMGTPNSDNDLIRMWVRVSSADAQGPTSGYYLFVDGGGHGDGNGTRFGTGSHTVGLAKMVGGVTTILASDLGNYNSGTTTVNSNGFNAWQATHGDVGNTTDWWNFKVTVTGSNIKVYATGKNPNPTDNPTILLADVDDSSFSAGKFAIENLSYASWYDNITFDPEPEPAKGEMITPSIPLTNMNTIVMSFDDSFQTEASAAKDTKKVYFSEDNGSTWLDITSSISPAVGGGGTQGWTSHSYTLPASANGDTVKFKFEFDSLDPFNNNFRGWNIDNFKIQGVQVNSDPPTSWAGGNGMTSGLNSTGNGIRAVGRTIDGMTTTNRYEYDPATGRIIDLFGDGDHADAGETANYGHFYGSTQTSNANNTIGIPRDGSGGDDAKLYDYIIDTSNKNFTAYTFNDNVKGGLRIYSTASPTDGISDSGFDGIQSIDEFETVARYYTDGTKVFDRFGQQKQNDTANSLADVNAADGDPTNDNATDNIHMTSNDDGIMGTADDEGLIDYDPGAPIEVDDFADVPVYSRTRIVQYDDAIAGEARIVTDSTGTNSGGVSAEGVDADGIQYKGSDSWNEYSATVNFGFNGLANADSYTYLRHQDANNWVRVRFTRGTGQGLFLEKSVGGTVSTLASLPSFNMLSPVELGRTITIDVEGRKYRVYDENGQQLFNYTDNSANPILSGAFALGATKAAWWDKVQLRPISLLNVLSLGDGIMTPTGPQDILDQMYLMVFRQQQGQNALRYDRQYGGTYFEETFASGPPEAKTPGQDGAGVIYTNKLEASNVNMSKQITHLAASADLYDTLSKQLVVYLDNISSVLSLFR
jgi:flagellar basal body rod protein FlgG